MNEEREKVYQILELGKHIKNLHHKKGFGGLLFIDLSMIKFSKLSSYIRQLDKENAELKKQLEEVEFIVGLRQKRNLIHKFDKEYDEEDKKKNPNRDYAGIMPDAEEVYRRYYGMKTQQQEFINYLEDKIYSIEPKGTGIIYNCEYDSEEDYVNAMKEQSRLNTLKEILRKYKSVIGVSDENA